MNNVQEVLVILITVLFFVSMFRWAPKKGLNQERQKLEKLKQEYENLIDYEPNTFTFIRDAGGFGRLDLSLIFYVPHIIIGLAIFVCGEFGYLTPKESQHHLAILLIGPTIAALTGSYLRWRYPVTKEYFLSFGKKR